MPEDYRHYVDHPHFGQRPRWTGQNPRNGEGDTYLHWINGPFVKGPLPVKPRKRVLWYDDGTRTVENTAVRADPTRRQVRPTVGVTHYFDLDKVCRGCGRRFLFFAEEQRHWYEELALPLEADCVRCVPCRKAARAVKALRHRYQDLAATEKRSVDETVELIDTYLTLVEDDEFSGRRLDRVREWWKGLPEEVQQSVRGRGLSGRLEGIKERGNTRGVPRGE